MIETVVMDMEQGTGQEYVVTTDPGAVARMRAASLRSLPWSAWSGVVGSVFMLVVMVGTVYFVYTTAVHATTTLLITLLMITCFVPIYLRDSTRRFAALRRLKQTWAVKEISPVAMRVTDEGLWCVVDAAPEPVFLPWAAVANVQVKGRGRLSVLLVALAPGAPTTPGVSGLNQPEVKSRTRRNRKGVSRLHLAVHSPLQPVSESEIDQALGHFSGGRVRVR
ncbi:hypothetical protein ABZ370_06070 [Streptomyces sp. NPDC005962]|uniref:hypothetical protein n=1 Tax=Streptomyces sp. NPDC005962 TaxID=3154466 RepID=UPI0033D702FD